MPEPRTCSILRTTAELEAVGPAWIDLWQRDSHATPFQRPEWLLPWWRAFGTPALRTVLIHRADTLVALLPLYIYRDETRGRDEPRGERQILLLGAGTSDYLDGIFAPECTSEDVCAALDLLRLEEDWHVAHLTQLRESSPLRQAMLSIPSAVERYSGEPTSRCAAVRIADLPKKLRGDIRYFRNAAIGRGELQFRLADESNCSDIFEELVREHTARWQSAGEAGVLADPLVLAWHREAMPLLQRSGFLRLCYLTLDAQIIATLYSLVDPPSLPDRPHRTQYLYLNGYSLDHANLQPGTLLQAYATEHALTEGVDTIDMLRGDEPYKQMWRVISTPTDGFAWRPHLLSSPMQQTPAEALA